MIVAGIDFGRYRIGIAITGDHGVVLPVTTIQSRSRASSLAAIKARLAELEVRHIVVGQPLNADGTAGPAAHAAEKFAAELRLIIDVPVELHDERLSSFEARERLRGGAARRKGDPRIDAVAACVILESWLNGRAQNNQGR
ncbi:MAG TPA: Holliday junction resolvase RuvX [Candidatus Binataceae bacterium]|nr:Holliday junction resolvase RuvX [Candidatus Binataceae bacterium]